MATAQPADAAGLPGFLVSVRGAPRVGPEVQKRAVAEAQAALLSLMQPALAAEGLSADGVSLAPVEVANRGVFVLRLEGGGAAAAQLVQSAYTALAAAVNAGSAAEVEVGFQFCDKIMPLMAQLPSAAPPTAAAISEAVNAMLGRWPLPAGSTVAVLVHARGDDAHGAAARGGAQLASVEVREAVLSATVGKGCGINLQTPDYAVVVTMWRATETEAPVGAVALLPGASIRTKPRLAPVRLPRPKICPDAAAAAKKAAAQKKRAQPDGGSGGPTFAAKKPVREPRDAVAAPVKLTAEQASTLFRSGLDRRAELLSLVRPPPAAAAADDRTSDCCTAHKPPPPPPPPYRHISTPGSSLTGCVCLQGG